MTDEERRELHALIRREIEASERRLMQTLSIYESIKQLTGKLAPPAANKVLSEAARRMVLARKHKAGGDNGGRPRSAARRCPCGAMTLKRAQARGRTAEHEAGCSFAREG